jgi:hypothetical protein
VAGKGLGRRLVGADLHSIIFYLAQFGGQGGQHDLLLSASKPLKSLPADGADRADGSPLLEEGGC